ncbi:MAG: RidA family protein [Oscillospiraceae bacterium]|nr:RidA family protein [Oscillospiraceae bacterium]
MDVYAKLEELGVELPAAGKVLGLYAPVKLAGGLAYVSGQAPMVDGKLMFTGKVSAGNMAQAQAAARQIAINTLALLHEELGDLNKIKSLVKVMAFVASERGFNEQPAVVNAYSQVFIDVFGENGRAARSAVGTNELPLDMPVEIEAIFEVKGVLE